MDKQQLHDFTTTEAPDLLNEEPKELTPDEVEELTPDEVEEALTELKEKYHKTVDKLIMHAWGDILEIRYTRKWYRAKKRALKHQPSFTYVDLDALTILFVLLAVIDVISLVTKLLGWW